MVPLSAPGPLQTRSGNRGPAEATEVVAVAAGPEGTIAPVVPGQVGAVTEAAPDRAHLAANWLPGTR